MTIIFAVAAFFLVLAIGFAFAARSDYLAGQGQWTPKGRARRRIALAFGIVGVFLAILGRQL